jgi:hypothetical protein
MDEAYKNNFLEWYKDFENNIRTTRKKYIPSDVDKWLNSIENSHKNIRERLDGECKYLSITTANAASDIFRPHLKIIHDIIPLYYATYDMSENDLMYPKIDKCNGNGISTAKHLLTYAKKVKVSENSMERLNAMLSELGKIWASDSFNKTYHVLISTSPKAFIRLGSYNDAGSCFVHGGMNNDKKYALAVATNSFVMFVTKSVASNIDDISFGNILCRLIGNANEDLTRFNTSNAYGRVDLYLNCIKDAIKEIGKFKNIHLELNKFKYRGGMNYINGPVWSFMEKKGDKTTIPQEDITLTDIYSKEYKPQGDYYANWDLK